MNWNAPVVNREIFEAFREDEGLRAGLRKSFERLCWFYGFVVKEEEGGDVMVSVISLAFVIKKNMMLIQDI